MICDSKCCGHNAINFKCRDYILLTFIFLSGMAKTTQPASRRTGSSVFFKIRTFPNISLVRFFKKSDLEKHHRITDAKLQISNPSAKLRGGNVTLVHTPYY